MPFCTVCGAEHGNGDQFCRQCGRALAPARAPSGVPPETGLAPPPKPAQPHRSNKRIVLALAIIGMAVIAIVIGVNWPGTVTAPELQPFANGTAGPTLDKAGDLCPAAPNWTDVIAHPASYRGRCVLQSGLVTFTNGPSVEFRLDVLTGSGNYESLWINFDPDGGLTKFWPTVDTSRGVSALGTIQGVKNGLPFIAAVEVYYSRTN